MPWFYLIPAALLFPAGIALTIWSLFWDRPRRGTLRCPRCWYDLTSLARVDRHSVPMRHATEGPSSAPPTCPECGHTARKPKHLRRTRRRWRYAALSPLIIVAAITLAVFPYVRAYGWAWLIPTPMLVYAAFNGHISPHGDPYNELIYRRVPYDDFWPGERRWVVGVTIRRLQNAPRTDQRRLAVSILGFVGARDRRVTDALLRAAEYDLAHDVRIPAVRMIGSYRADADRALPVLIRIIESDPDTGVRLESLRSLSRYRTTARHTAPAILCILEQADPESHLAVQAISALGAMQLDASVILPHLIRILLQGDEHARYSALGTLESLGPDAAPAIPHILWLIQSNVLSSTEPAVRALGSFGPAARDALPILDRGPLTPYLDSIAIGVIEGHYGSMIEGHLATLLDPQSPFRREAAQELRRAAVVGASFSTADVETLIVFIQDEPDPRLTSIIAHSLGNLPGAHAPPIFPILQNFAEDDPLLGQYILNVVLREETPLPVPPVDENAR